MHLEAKSPGVHVPRAMAVMLMQVRHAAARSSVSHRNRVLRLQAVSSLARARRGTTVIDEEAHGGTAMKTLYTSPSNMIWQKVKFGFGTPSMKSGKAVLVSKKCIHGRPFGNVDGFCFYNLEVVQY